MVYNLSIDKETTMGYYKDITLQVDEMYADGFTPIEISERTGLSFEEVVEILNMLEEFTE